MNRTPVSSSNVASIGYDENTMTLEIEFNDGSVYQYFEVPYTLYQGLMQAGSIGGFLSANVKKHYRYVKM